MAAPESVETYGVRRVTDAAEWDLALSAAGCEVLQSWEWGDLKRKFGGWQPCRLGLYLDQNLVGGIQILERDIKIGPIQPLRIHYAPRGPVIVSGSKDGLKELLENAVEYGRSRSAAFLKIDPMWPADSSYAKLFVGPRWKPAGGGRFGGLQPKSVMVLNLRQGAEETLNQMHHKWRYNIRLAEKKGVRVEEWPSHQLAYAALDEILPRWYDLLLETARRDRFLVRTRAYFAEMLRLLGAKQMARLFLAYKGDQMLGGTVCTCWGPRAVYNYGASGNYGRNLMFSHLLQWRAIWWAKSIGCEIYDFRGVAVHSAESSSRELEGLDRFKAGFGAEYLEYVGEFDAVLRPWRYRLWNLAPKFLALIKKRRQSESAVD